MHSNPAQVHRRLRLVRVVPGEALLHAAVLPLCLDARRAAHSGIAVLPHHSGTVKGRFNHVIYVIVIIGICLSIRIKSFSMTVAFHVFFSLFQNMFEGLIWFIIPILMVVINDVMAYMFGFFFGKTPLIQLSPKKTWWEGEILEASLLSFWKQN